MKKHQWISPCASILCLIHCVGFTLLGLPSLWFLNAFTHSPLVDWGIIVINAILGFFSLKTMMAPRKYFYILAAIILASSISLLFKLEDVFHGTIFANAIFQLVLMERHHRNPKKNKKDCCDHKH